MIKLIKELLHELRRLTMAIDKLNADIATLASNVALLTAQVRLRFRNLKLMLLMLLSTQSILPL